MICTEGCLRVGRWKCVDRLKVSLASGHYTARLAMSCSLFRDAYSNMTYGNKSMLHWCEREGRWASDWLLKTYLPGNGTALGEWGTDDRFVAMVRPITCMAAFYRCHRHYHTASHALCRQVSRWARSRE